MQNVTSFTGFNHCGKTNTIIPIYQISMPFLAPFAHWEFNMRIQYTQTQCDEGARDGIGIWHMEIMWSRDLIYRTRRWNLAKNTEARKAVNHSSLELWMNGLWWSNEFVSRLMTFRHNGFLSKKSSWKTVRSTIHYWQNHWKIHSTNSIKNLL